MLDWIIKNKEWLFSGVGVALVLGIVTFARAKGWLRIPWSTKTSSLSQSSERSAAGGPSPTVPEGPTDSKPAKLEVQRWMRRFSLQVGDYCQFEFTSVQTIRVQLIEIIRSSKDPSLKNDVSYAKISISTLGLPTCGHEAKPVGYQTFLVPPGRGWPSECVFELSIAPSYIAIYQMWVNHIQPRKELVELDVITLRS